MPVVSVIDTPFDYPPGPKWVPYTAGKVYSAQLRDDDNFDFEVRGTDRYQSAVYSDPINVMRSEVIGPFFEANTSIRFGYRLMLAPGPASTNAWLVCGQLHAGDDVVGASPVMSLNILGDGMGSEIAWVNLNRRLIGESQIRYDRIGSFPFVRGVSYDIDLGFIDRRGGPNGRAWLNANGRSAANFYGATGYSGQTTKCYPKFGIYAGGRLLDSAAQPDPNQVIRASYYKPLFVAGGPA